MLGRAELALIRAKESRAVFRSRDQLGLHGHRRDGGPWRKSEQPMPLATRLAILWSDVRVKLLAAILAIVIPMAILLSYLPPYHRVFYIHHDGQLLRCSRQGRRPVCRVVPEPPPHRAHGQVRIHGG